MKTLAGCISFFCVLTVPIVSAVAQITITASDVSTIFATGKSITQYSDTLTTQVNIGVPGPTATSWNFSSFNRHTPTSLTSVAASSTPYISQFAGATHALQTTQSVVYAGIPVTLTIYQYLILGQGLSNPGNMGGGTVNIPPFGNFPVELKTTNAPSDLTYALPSTLGTSWTSAYTQTTVITLSGSPVSNTTTNHSLSHIVDAYGSMTLPGGVVQQALRVRNVDVVSGQKKISYTFISNNGAIVQVGTCDTTLPSSGNIPVCSISWNGGGPTDVPVNMEIPDKFALLQNYPNPFNPSTLIHYQLPMDTYVSLRVYDLLGRQVAVLVNEKESPGNYAVRFDGSGLASGVYVYKLEAGGFVATKKLVMVR
jgi:hypothetical protein